jgi:hypothetical protein
MCLRGRLEGTLYEALKIEHTTWSRQSIAARRSSVLLARSARIVRNSWVKLRNPWGHMVRAYVRGGEDKSNLKPLELNVSPTGAPPAGLFIKPESETQSVVGLARQGLFWLELSDFAKRFSHIQSGATRTRSRR